MNATFDRLYRQLGRVTCGVLFATLFVYGVALVCALLGFSHAVTSFVGVAASLAYVFVALLGVFLLTSLVAALIRWADRQNQPRGSGSA
jgi:hypothetical protein